MEISFLTFLIYPLNRFHTSASVVAHFDPKLPIKVVANASSLYGLGAVLAHVVPDMTECPYAYVSKVTLFY